MFGLDWTTVVVSLVERFGYLAVFVFTFLEASLLFPLLPSEAVLPAAAVLLVEGPVSYALFVLSATAGVSVGSLVAYYLFGRGGEEVLERYGPLVRVSERELRWSRGWFRRYGESAVFWGRLLPVLRSAVSIPAGFAAMDRGKFLLYSTAGGLLFNGAVGALALSGDGSESVYGAAFGFARRAAAALAARPALAFAAATVAALALAYAAVRWRGRGAR